MDSAAEARFREFVVANSVALLRLAYLLSGGDQHAAEDLLQISLTKTATRWSTVKSPELYVRRVMYRQQVDWWRLKWRRRETHVAVLPDKARHDDTPASDLKIVVHGALARLTPRQRAVLVLRFFEDLPEGEVARLLECSVGTVRSTTHRSLARLRELAPELNELRLIEEVR
ncbi:SigE family RNA polymerase sigma factor [Planotetraspora kaengkrachanensis]|uniref:RNA polymerase sigma24 factor n=1 Tax=Planotetraspora kaengkrachanensis TaxID=575193 RepID=A0A8J3PRT5_9ACTN|nr:SigE family RNA polymerase sigma factor [Planotetraspora kaengkrachanensis]GIG79547.1 RNA polymerase sigma24 factor [Planotetraspora kaengkrachanensis]